MFCDEETIGDALLRVGVDVALEKPLKSTLNPVKYTLEALESLLVLFKAF